jgi:hypothetical protein
MTNMAFDEVETVDVSDYKTAHGAAQAAADVVRDFARTLGHDPDTEVTCRKEDSGAWVVYYEAGPNNWAYDMTGGGGFYGTDPQIAGLLNADGFDVECKYSFALAFYGR